MSSTDQVPRECITLEDLRDLIGELRRMAAQLLSGESKGHTYTPTGLAMTALRRVKLKEQDWADVKWENRAHFFSAIWKAMRNALIDHARRRQAKGRSRLEYHPPDEGIFHDLPAEAEERPERVLLLEDALARLDEADGPLAELVRLYYYLGYSVAEMARFLDVNEKTVDRNLKKARVLLRKFIEDLSRGA